MASVVYTQPGVCSAEELSHRCYLKRLHARAVISLVLQRSACDLGSHRSAHALTGIEEKTASMLPTKAHLG